MFQKILFPTDQSEHSQRALSHVKEIASKFHSKVVLLQVYEIPPEWTTPLTTDGFPNPTMIELKNTLLKRSQSLLVEVQKELKEYSVETLVKEGKPGPIIVETAEKDKCDLVVMGSRGLGMVKSFMLGSTSTFCLNHLKCPLLIVH